MERSARGAPLAFVGPLLHNTQILPIQEQAPASQLCRLVVVKDAVKESAEKMLVAMWSNKATVLAAASVLYAAGYCAISAAEAFTETDCAGLKHSAGPLAFTATYTAVFVANCIDSYKTKLR